MVNAALLLVDDHAYFRKSLGRICEINGFHILAEAATGRQAVALAERLQPDVVLLADKLPDIDSKIVANRIQRSNPHIAVIFLTFFYQTRIGFAALPGMEWFVLPKDCDEETLVTTIKRAYQPPKSTVA